jgi:hypothetical protein
MEETKKKENPTNPTIIKKRDPKAAFILESLRNGESIIKSCKAAGIHPSTFWEWRKADPELNQATEAAIDSRVMVVEDALYTECIKGNSTLIMFFLMNRASGTWKDKRAQPNVGVGVRVEAPNGRIESGDDILRDVVALAKRVNPQGSPAR